MPTDNAGPSHEQPGNEPAPTALQELPRSVPSFVCVLPCTKQVVKYGDGLDGCVTGIHLTREETKDIHVLYRKMAEVILAKSTQLVWESSPDPCVVCKAPIVLNPISPMIYMENCAHYLHYGCFKGLPSSRSGHFQVDCPGCEVSSNRALLWPQLFPTASAKNEHFQIQKRGLGLDVAPQTVLQVNKCYVDIGFPSFDLFVNGKYLTVHKSRPELIMREPSSLRPAPSVPGREPSGYAPCECGDHDWPSVAKVTETYLVQVIQRLQWPDRARLIYLGDMGIIPLYKNGRKVPCGLKQRQRNFTKRQKLLLQFRCPFNRVDGPKGEQCSQGLGCEFWHGWPKNTPKFIVEQVKVRDFPSFFCLKNSRNSSHEPSCIEGIRVHSEELVRCAAGFHPSTEDLQNMKRFAHKMN